MVALTPGFRQPMFCPEILYVPVACPRPVSTELLPYVRASLTSEGVPWGLN